MCLECYKNSKSLISTHRLWFHSSRLHSCSLHKWFLDEIIRSCSQHKSLKIKRIYSCGLHKWFMMIFLQRVGVRDPHF